MLAGMLASEPRSAYLSRLHDSDNDGLNEQSTILVNSLHDVHRFLLRLCLDWSIKWNSDLPKP